ncbi:MAG: hypothetical protein Q4A67_00240 [Aerococcus sp.]|nr:hypothetical protein [Aerococcus sp.]
MEKTHILPLDLQFFVEEEGSGEAVGWHQTRRPKRKSCLLLNDKSN